MTAEEIRGICKNSLQRQPDLATAEVSTLMQIEIAAQLAELNANLTRIFHADSEHTGPRLKIDRFE